MHNTYRLFLYSCQFSTLKST